MAALNLSSNGPSITKSYQSIVNAPPPSGPAAASPTYAQWALFSVSAPLASAFQQDAGGKESILKVQTTGDGELLDLIEEFSDGRIQFAFVRVKDPNTALPKNVLIGWCGEGVPERTKGYFTSHLASVAKIFHGYHVQVTARSDRDLSPEGIVTKVSEASGSKYSGGGVAPSASGGRPLPPANKPAFTPTRFGGGTGGFNPLAGSQSRNIGTKDVNVDKDGWGEDAPPVSRTQLEKVQSSYQPTKVNMAELTKQKQEQSNPAIGRDREPDPQDGVIRGGYQPVGKVDIAALRRQAQQSGSTGDDRPTIVKGAYEPIGKVDIAAIRSKAQPKPTEEARPPPVASREQASPQSTSTPRFGQSERLTSLPKPKVGNKFGSGTGSFMGTKAPTPVGIGGDQKAAVAPAPVGTASRTFADEGGKTPAQVWAEKKARQRGLSGAGDSVGPTAGNPGPASPITSQPSGGEWKSGYAGKSWAPVQISTTGRSAGSNGAQQNTEQDEPTSEAGQESASGGIGALRDRFKGAAPMGLSQDHSGERSAPSPPPLATSSKPNAGGVAIPGLPTRGLPPANEPDDEEVRPGIPTPPAVPRSPTPPTPPVVRSSSPIRVAMPVGRGSEPPITAPAERSVPTPIPVASIVEATPHEDDLTEEPIGHDPARGAGEAAAATTFGQHAAAAAPVLHPDEGQSGSGKRALVQYDYEKAEDNEIELREGEYVENIDMVDDDWWMGQNAQGETGLFPSNYVELVEGEEESHHGGAVE
ncbi:MAG: hypothetical protein M1825_006254, partial [Sarcosagium campestre]